MASQSEDQGAILVGLAYESLASCIAVGFCYGVAVSLFYASLWVPSLFAERTSKARRILLAITSVMFLLNTGVFTCRIALEYMRVGDVVTKSAPLSQINTGRSPFYVCANIFEMVNFVASDAIVVWRAIVLYRDSPLSSWMRVGFCLLLLAQIGIPLSLLIIWASTDVAHFLAMFRKVMEMNATRVLLSLATNLLATLCIGVKAWKLRHTLRNATIVKSPVDQVLTLLVECGLVFCVVQFFYSLCLFVPNHNQRPGSSIGIFSVTMLPFFSLFAGMYPSLVIVVMAKQQSLFSKNTVVSGSDNIPQSNVHSPRTLSTLHFATVLDLSEQTHSRSHSFTGHDSDSSKDGASLSAVPVRESYPSSDP